MLLEDTCHTLMEMVLNPRLYASKNTFGGPAQYFNNIFYQRGISRNVYPLTARVLTKSLMKTFAFQSNVQATKQPFLTLQPKQ